MKAWGERVIRHKVCHADIKTDSIFVKVSPTTKHLQKIRDDAGGIELRVENIIKKIPYADYFKVEE